MTKHQWASEFPNLFHEVTWGPLRCKFEARDAPPPPELISNVNVVPFVGGQCVLLRLQDGRWEIPGGTVEPGETYEEAIRRELLEEGGARLVNFNVLGTWHCRSSRAIPYRPHLPHPEFYRLVGYGEVELIGQPTRPVGGEGVEMVECVSLDAATQRFRSIGRQELAELYGLAAVVRQGQRSG